MLPNLQKRIDGISKRGDDQLAFFIEKRAGHEDAAFLAKKIEEFVCLMPVLISRIHHYWDPAESWLKPMKTQEVGRFVLKYIYDNDTQIPLTQDGWFQYIDDAYFISLLYGEVLDEAQKLRISIDSCDAGLRDRVQELASYVHKVIPSEAKTLENILSEWMLQRPDDNKACLVSA